MEPYGQAQVLSSSVGLALRLPGQWEETEASDLARNWHRNYDPTLGRYVEADPLGIEAGQNLYTYVDGDPLGGVDPEGLLVQATFSISSGLLTVTDLDTGASMTARAFSGTDEAGTYESEPIPYGEYDILDYQSKVPGHADWFRLDPKDRFPRDDIDQRGRDVRGSPGSYRLHFGHLSLGCVTVRNRNNYDHINSLIRNTRKHVSVDSRHCSSADPRIFARQHGATSGS